MMTTKKQNLFKLPIENTEVLDRLNPNYPAVVVAGHYSLADYMEDVSSNGESEVTSFAVGVSLVSCAIKQGKTMTLVLFINDIGITGSHRENLKNNYTLPENYQKIMDQASLERKHLTVVFESAMRNKASTLLRKIYKREPEIFERVNARDANLVRCVSSTSCDFEPTGHHAYVVSGPSGEKLVVKEGPNPKCNLILATFFNEISKKLSPKVIINVFNEIYAYRLSLGVHVCQQVLKNKTSFKNIYCDGVALVQDLAEYA